MGWKREANIALERAEMCVEVRSMGLKIRTRTFPTPPLTLPVCMNLDKELSFSKPSEAYATHLVVCCEDPIRLHLRAQERHKCSLNGGYYVSKDSWSYSRDFFILNGP